MVPGSRFVPAAGRGCAGVATATAKARPSVADRPVIGLVASVEVRTAISPMIAGFSQSEDMRNPGAPRAPSG